MNFSHAMMLNHHSTYQITTNSICLIKIRVLNSYFVLKMMSWRCYCYWTQLSSSGPDGISATMLKQTAVSIAPGITKLMNMSICSGKLPTAWKISSVVPVPKGSNHTSVKQLQADFSASNREQNLMLEKHIHSLIFNHLNEHHPIALQQWGFQPKKSTVVALADITYNWCRALDQGSEVCAVFSIYRRPSTRYPIGPFWINSGFLIWTRIHPKMGMFIPDEQETIICCPKWRKIICM